MTTNGQLDFKAGMHGHDSLVAVPVSDTNLTRNCNRHTRIRVGFISDRVRLQFMAGAALIQLRCGKDSMKTERWRNWVYFLPLSVFV